MLIIKKYNNLCHYHLWINLYKMSEFYSKYRHLFEEGASDFSHFRNGYDQ